MSVLHGVAEIFFVVGFIFAFFVDHLPLSFRVLGFKLELFPISTLRSTQIMILNRFGAAFFFTTSGFLVDTGASVDDILFLFSVAWLTLGVVSFFYIRSWTSVARFLSKIVFGVNESDVKTSIVSVTWRDALVNYPFFFNLAGISLPVLAASVFPHYRATLMQAGFVFNSVATLLLVFVIEPRFVSYISDKKGEQADHFHQKLIFSKAIILLTGGAGFLALSAMCGAASLG